MLPYPTCNVHFSSVAIVSVMYRSVFCFVLLFLPAILTAQPLGGIYGLAALPIGELKTNGYRPGIGFGFEFLSGDLAKYTYADKLSNHNFRIRGGAAFSFTSFG